MRVLAASMVAVSFFLGLPHAEAASREAMEREAKKACLNGFPTRGVEILTDLYVDTNDLTYIFNQGRCFEQNRRYEDAIGRFREYLLKGEHLSDEEKSAAQKHITACQSFLEDKAATPPQATAQGPKPPSATPEQSQSVVDIKPGPAAEPLRAVELAKGQRPVAASHPGSGLRTAGIATAAVGVAGLVTGLALNLKVNSMASELSKVDQYDAGTDSTRKDYKTLGWVGYGVGTACLAGGVVLYYLGWRNGRDAATTALVPSAGPSMAGVALVGEF